jgi:type III pantothenate kinase
VPNYLLINNNNSRTKFALADRDRLLDSRANLATQGLTADLLTKTVATWDYETVVLTSVVPHSAAIIRNAFASKPRIEVAHTLNLGVTLDFPDPSTIGADRLANAAAVVALFQEVPAIVVDFGTAVTFDIISANRAYIGGIIAPGLDVMTDYLHQRTALLPKIDLEEPEELIGKSTRSAMLSGAVHGYRGLIKEILARLTENLCPPTPGGGSPKKPLIVSTGGYAQLISAKITSIDGVFPDLTLDGMRLIANLNRPASLREG